MHGGQGGKHIGTVVEPLRLLLRDSNHRQKVCTGYLKIVLDSILLPHFSVIYKLTFTEQYVMAHSTMGENEVVSPTTYDNVHRSRLEV